MTNDNTNADKVSRSDDDATGAATDESFTADQVDSDDKHKTEKLTKAGRDIDPNEGTD